MNSLRVWLGHAWVKPCVFALALMPSVWLLVAALTDRLGANPAEALERATGLWALRMLCVVLAITPLRVILQLAVLARWRRMLGLFVFYYAVLHASAYAVFDMGLAWSDIMADIAKRPFVLVGALGLVLLAVLAATSFNRAIRWLGGRRWQWLHRAVYAVAVLVILHFYWMRAGKNNFADVVLYGAVLAGLLGWRLRRLLGDGALGLGGRYKEPV